jgi:S-adenosylmethionine synthetase
MKTTRNIIVENAGSIPSGMQRIELVERKGTGHPDTICDSLIEAVSTSLCREYRERTGRLLHHNIDKGGLIAGRTLVKPGGGKVLEPMTALDHSRSRGTR